MASRIVAWSAVACLLVSACAATGDDTVRDVPREDAEADVPTGALVPVAPPVEVFSSDDNTLGPVLLTSLTGSAAVIWGERDPTDAWTGPGFAMLDGDGNVETAAVHLPDTGHEPVGLEPHSGLHQLAYFTMQREAGCTVHLYRRMLDTLGRITGAMAETDVLDDPLGVYTASIGGNAVVLAVEGNACTARDFPAARMIVVASDGTASGDVPLGEADLVSGLTARPDGSGYMALRYTHDGGILIDMVGLGGGRERGWTIVRRDGSCACASARGVLAASGTDYLAAWVGAIATEQSWYLHRGPYDDEQPLGEDPVVTPFDARTDRIVAAVPFQGGYVLAYVPSDGSVPLRIDLLGADRTFEAGWSPEVTGEVTSVALAPIGAHLAAAWVERWAGATAPSVLKAGLFAPR
jgi:hypothetical protein